jgi:pimeloyl-ACP methyl ester carboxylesterase
MQPTPTPLGPAAPPFDDGRPEGPRDTLPSELERTRIRPRRWLLLRGLGRERRHWFGFADRLSSTLQVPCEPFDLPGVGEGRFETVPVSVAATAEVVSNRLARWMDGVGGPVGVFGLSFGAMVGLELCRSQPGWFSHAVVVNSSSRWSPPWLRLRPDGVWLVARSLLSQDVVERETRIYELTLGERVRSAREYASVAAGFGVKRPVERQTVVKQLVAASRFLPRDVWQPVLVLSGKRDRLVAPSCSVDLASALGAVHLQHERAGHDLPLEEPEWVTEQVARWLDSSDAQPT